MTVPTARPIAPSDTTRPGGRMSTSRSPRRRLRRRRGLAVLGAAALVVAACSDPPTSGGDRDVAAGDGEEAELPDCPVDALEDAEGPVEVTLWFGGLAGSANVAMRQIVDAFNASQDQVVVNASDQGVSYAEVYREFTSAAAAGDDQ